MTTPSRTTAGKISDYLGVGNRQLVKDADGNWQSVPLDKATPFICKICDRGELRKKRLYRMSWPVVVIGGILVVPSVLGMGISAVALLQLAFPGGAQANGEAMARILASGAVLSAFAISLVGGLLGFLLIMQKSVLKYSCCEAVTNTS